MVGWFNAREHDLFPISCQKSVFFSFSHLNHFPKPLTTRLDFPEPNQSVTIEVTDQTIRVVFTVCTGKTPILRTCVKVTTGELLYILQLSTALNSF